MSFKGIMASCMTCPSSSEPVKRDILINSYVSWPFHCQTREKLIWMYVFKNNSRKKQLLARSKMQKARLNHHFSILLVIYVRFILFHQPTLWGFRGQAGQVALHKVSSETKMKMGTERWNGDRTPVNLRSWKMDLWRCIELYFLLQGNLSLPC